MTLGEYMYWSRHKEVFAPQMVSEESPLKIYEKYYKHTPLSLEQRLRVLACLDLYADDDLEEPVYLDDIIVESNDLETVDIHDEVSSSNLNCEIPIGHLATYDNESIIHDIVTPLSPCFVDSSYDFLIVHVNTGAICNGQVTDDFEPILICLAHFEDSDDPMIIHNVHALCPMISSEVNVSNECISADLEPDLECASRIQTNIHSMFVFHVSDLFISTKECFLLRMDLHIFLKVYSVCRFIFTAALICWIDPQLFRLYIYICFAAYFGVSSPYLIFLACTNNGTTIMLYESQPIQFRFMGVNPSYLYYFLYLLFVCLNFSS
ncbi:uncharacterized protein LOC113321936 [Papaver somniferum]|uniref:uncharacterized protein LOC113321936 n=1 Tax=Papaver somniferum TaxID=3469 RepID=UPI000E70212E|nr:uncharacterized protein LOC113321936 [Papaver somniferum]XP_026425698.1 uncharacterized protein LOC113321936 [Papaver somniferum]